MAKVKCGTTRTGKVFCSKVKKNRRQTTAKPDKDNKAYDDSKIKYSHRGTAPPRVGRDRGEKMKPKIKKMTKKKAKTMMKKVVAKPVRVKQPGAVATVGALSKQQKVNKLKEIGVSGKKLDKMTAGEVNTMFSKKFQPHTVYQRKLGKKFKDFTDEERKKYNRIRVRFKQKFEGKAYGRKGGGGSK